MLLILNTLRTWILADSTSRQCSGLWTFWLTGFSRAESTFERRYYRALAMLSAMRQAANSKSDLDSLAVSEVSTKSAGSGTKSPDGGTKT